MVQHNITGMEEAYRTASDESQQAEPGPGSCRASSVHCESKLRVGCALRPHKASRYLTPGMLEVAASRGIELYTIDYTKPLLEQGRFDAIVHKLGPNAEWESNLSEYLRRHPEVAVIDRVDGIRTLQNRSTMLLPLQGSGILMEPTNGCGPKGSRAHAVRVQAPAQVVIPDGTTLQEAEQLLHDAGLQPPLLVKALWTDGRKGSHSLAVLHDLQALDKLLQGNSASELRPPLVVQHFVTHGGVLFKVYVLGSRTVVTKRPSLGDNHMGSEARRKGVLHLPRISCMSAMGSSSDVQGLAAQQPSTPVSSSRDEYMPPEWMSHALATVLRERLGLQLFNFDLIYPDEQAADDERLYYVIDINYFPGVDKLPNFEQVFVDFLWASCMGEHAAGENSSSPGSEGQQGVVL